MSIFSRCELECYDEMLLDVSLNVMMRCMPGIGNLLFLILESEDARNFIIIIVITLLCVKILDCHSFYDNSKKR